MGFITPPCPLTHKHMRSHTPRRVRWGTDRWPFSCHMLRPVCEPQGLKGTVRHRTGWEARLWLSWKPASRRIPTSLHHVAHRVDTCLLIDKGLSVANTELGAREMQRGVKGALVLCSHWQAGHSPAQVGTRQVEEASMADGWSDRATTDCTLGGGWPAWRRRWGVGGGLDGPGLA